MTSMKSTGTAAEKQSELLRFIHERLQESGAPPSISEMKEALDLRSKSGIHRLITALEERGFIRRLANRARAIEVLRLPESATVVAPRLQRFSPSVIPGNLGRVRPIAPARDPVERPAVMVPAAPQARAARMVPERIPPKLLAQLDALVAAQPEPTPKRSKVIQELICEALNAGRARREVRVEDYGLTKKQLAETIGIAPEALYKRERLGAAKTQSRLREMNEILTRVAGWAGGPAQAMAWYRAEPIPAFGGRTAEALVKSGQAGPLRDYLDSIALGGFA
jgi:LexA DNA binding domain/Protein of unknown function (DUF2384)